MNRISTSSVNSSFNYTAPTEEAQNRFASAPDNSPLVATTTSIAQASEGLQRPGATLSMQAQRLRQLMGSPSEQCRRDTMLAKAFDAQRLNINTQAGPSNSPHLNALNTLQQRHFKPAAGGLEIPVTSNSLLGGGRQVYQIGSSSRELSHRPVNDQDRAPFRALERLHAELFRGGPIEFVPKGSNVLASNVRDVDMDEFDVINSKDGCQGIGTTGLGPCIAVCARGMDREGLPVLGVYHHSGIGSPEDTMATLDQAMREKGALQIKYSLVGGMIMPKEEEAGSYDDEQSFLALKGSYSIEGARLHVSEGEEDVHTGEDNSVNVLLMPDRVLYGRDTLYC
ncbi:Type III effector HopK1 [Pseudomonas syringae pv. cilantro]|uniref:Type III effector HopK1 n=2 Tax=Pseudomonas syringae group TaxID=136849 RepID=A0A0N1JNR2_PSESX|nr:MULTISPECIES: XopAK family type III secretion system effector [Pseudomonas syringae group]KPC30060.1 Type III effector HopK1 [Pseudomonas syringae pv. cilantro]KPW77011.1 Type III effector HopK1 [Pseudomonas syringae pv. coriandricola]RMN10253.1 Type III effector HopK1 [Pseudomonas syringae pv. coriandricola]